MHAFMEPRVRCNVNTYRPLQGRPTQSSAHLGFTATLQGDPKMAQLLCMPQLYHILTDFENYFTVRIRRKFVIILLSLKIPPHLKCVATLPCEMSSVLKATIDNKTTSATTNNTF